MKKKAYKKPTMNSSGKQFRSKNTIPWNIRSLLKRRENSLDLTRM